ncbi:efflux RND transporter periplasmic adaptor subunit [Anseongella ginsenosidimutans]|nr:HlyD family efflux transporter periplasmic adaptor subunit [Anseongella ginsenosidimutans]
MAITKITATLAQADKIMDRKLEKKFWTKQRIFMMGGGALLVFVLLYSLVFADHRSKLNVEREKITVSTVQKGIFDEYIVVTAVVQPLKTIRLDAVQGGYVVGKYLDGGTMVEKGDSILRLENQDLTLSYVNHETEIYRLINELQSTRLQLRQNRYQLESALSDLQAQLKAAKDLYDRNKLLYDDQVISEQEFLKYKIDYERLKEQNRIEVESQKYQEQNAELQIKQLEGTIDRTQRNLELMKASLDNLIIRAPISGLLSSIDVEVGSSISAGENIGQIDVIDGYKLRAQIDEHYISRLFAGLKASFEFGGKTHELTVRKVYPEVLNGRFEVDLEFAGAAPEGIRRGLSLPVRVGLGKSAEAVLLSSGGFFSHTGGNWVYVLDGDGTRAVKRSITLGRKNPEYFEVLEGLQPGEKVITSSYDNFGDKEVLQMN